MGEIVKAGLLRPVDRLREGLRLGRPLLADAAGPEQVLGRRQPSSAPASCTGSRRWARSSASTTTRTKVPTPPTTLTEFEASLQEAKDAGETPIMFGNLEKWPGIHNFESVLGQTADKQAIRDFVFAKDGASLRQPGVPGRRHEDQGVGRQGLLQQGLQRHGLRPGVAGRSPRARAAYLIAGTWVTADLAEGDGRQRRLHADAGQRPERAGLARRRGPAVDDHARRPRTRTSRRPTSTSSPTPTRPRCSSTPNNLPAMKDAPAPAERRVGGRRQRVAEAQRGRRRDPVPGLHDADASTTTSAAPSRSCWRASRSPTEFTAGVQEAYEQVGGVPLT